ncbi:MAG: acyltransferase family protein [Turneriella sp.]
MADLISRHISYRADLQGLRAVAVILVFLFHVWPDSIRGGFIGVDAFFVISGFLITSLLLAEVEKTGRLDLADFWSRRLRRLLPAATLVLLVSLYAALRWLPETEWINTAKQVFGSALYVQNWMLVAQSVDYLAREASPTVVQHYWSLSIEEQFYFAWPLIVFVAAWFTRKAGHKFRPFILIYSAGILIVSFIWSSYVLRGTPQGYFTTTTRAWELAIGSTLAILWPWLKLNAAFRIALSWVGLAMLMTAAFTVREGFAFPGWIAIVPTLGTAFLILGNQTRFAAATILGTQPLRFIGDISYAIYLWHWPIIVVAKQVPQLAGWPAWKFSGAIIVLTLVLSILTKYFVEDPFRSGFLAFGLKANKRRMFVAGSLITALLLIGAGAGVSANTWYKEEKIAAELKAKEKATIYPKSEYPGAAAMDALEPASVPAGLPVKPNPVVAEYDLGAYAYCMGKTGSFAVRPCEFGNRNGTTKIVLTGDSHAMQYGTALEKVAKLHDWRLVVLSKPACPFGDFPVYWEGYQRGECEHWKKESYKIIAAMKPDLMITTTARAGVYQQLPSKERQIQGYKQYWQKYLDLGIRVAVIRDNPLMRGGPLGWMSPPSCVYQHSKTPADCDNPRKKSLEDLVDLMVTTAQQMQNVPIIDLSDYFCDKQNCRAVIGNILVYRDNHHITDAFGVTLAPYIDKAVKKILKMPAPPVVTATAVATPVTK